METYASGEVASAGRIGYLPARGNIISFFKLENQVDTWIPYAECFG